MTVRPRDWLALWSWGWDHVYTPHTFLTAGLRSVYAGLHLCLWLEGKPQVQMGKWKVSLVPESCAPKDGIGAPASPF